MLKFRLLVLGTALIFSQTAFCESTAIKLENPALPVTPAPAAQTALSSPLAGAVSAPQDSTEAANGAGQPFAGYSDIKSPKTDAISFESSSWSSTLARGTPNDQAAGYSGVLKETTPAPRSEGAAPAKMETSSSATSVLGAVNPFEAKVENSSYDPPLATGSTFKRQGYVQSPLLWALCGGLVLVGVACLFEFIARRRSWL